jgi:hypothetical protein
LDPNVDANKEGKNPFPSRMMPAPFQEEADAKERRVQIETGYVESLP